VSPKEKPPHRRGHMRRHAARESIMWTALSGRIALASQDETISMWSWRAVSPTALR